MLYIADYSNNVTSGSMLQDELNVCGFVIFVLYIAIWCYHIDMTLGRVS